VGTKAAAAFTGHVMASRKVAATTNKKFHPPNCILLPIQDDKVFREEIISIGSTDDKDLEEGNCVVFLMEYTADGAAFVTIPLLEEGPPKHNSRIGGSRW